MEDSESTYLQDEEKVQDNSDEIGWVFYGILSTFTLVVYQFFLVELANIPSTISVKMGISVTIGVAAMMTVSFIKLLNYFRAKREQNEERHRSLRLSDELIIDPMEDSEYENERIGRKNSLWKYFVGYTKKIK
jgi:hypothetical protein